MEEVRRLEEHFDGLQTEHVPRAKNSIADHLSKCAAQKLPVEPRTFVFHLTQPSVSPSALARKRRKINTGKHSPAELPKAASEKVAGGNPMLAGELRSPAELQVLAIEASSPTVEEMPLVFVVEPQALAWVQHIVQFSKTGELPDNPEESEKVARQSSMYQFVGDILYRKRPNGMKLKCISQEDGLMLLAEIHGGVCGSHPGSRALVGKDFRQGFY
ncbi:uncharacterized protein [Aegilops tauschii subsp. strangulata]|uniref:uncharacterized protein n=1 Tax=Aegilops tauschii subsp. strangulata TaxID=200361 RepID=UPI00098A4822|nr:uncharacterized protein LOC109738822 [Aegilops tauschii subsp. strangulata]